MMIWQVTKNLFKNHKTIWISRSLAAFGSIFVIDEVFVKFGIIPDDPKNHYNLIILLFTGCIIYGLIYTIRRVISYTIKLPSDGNIMIEFGDLLQSNTDYIFIPVNDFFDVTIGNTSSTLVSSKSILGQYIVKAEKQETIKNEIDTILENVKTLGEDLYRKQRHLPYKKYENGTCIFLEPCGEVTAKAVLVASTFTEFIDEKPFSNSTIPLIAEAICSCLDTLPEKKSIAFPLVGGGFSRINLETNQLLQIIIGCIIERAQKLRITSPLKIILQAKFKGELPLYYLKKEWTVKN